MCVGGEVIHAGWAEGRYKRERVTYIISNKNYFSLNSMDYRKNEKLVNILVYFSSIKKKFIMNYENIFIYNIHVFTWLFQTIPVEAEQGFHVLHL